jgi:hypothetical protein
MSKESQMTDKLIEISKQMKAKKEVVLQFKKRTNYTWEVWTDNEDGGDYIRNITIDDIYVLCTEIESENEILDMSPKDFISMVWDLCSYRIFDNYDNFDYYSANFDAFSKWFDKEVLDWYCEMIMGLI